MLTTPLLGNSQPNPLSRICNPTQDIIKAQSTGFYKTSAFLWDGIFIINIGKHISQVKVMSVPLVNIKSCWQQL